MCKRDSQMQTWKHTQRDKLKGEGNQRSSMSMEREAGGRKLKHSIGYVTVGESAVIIYW